MQPDRQSAPDQLSLDYAEFYITNVCNLNCDRCNRFNNFNFSGHQRWDDVAETYAQWAKILRIKTIGMLGGEPMLNPDFPRWLLGVLDLWPDSDVLVITNGTQLKKWQDLYDLARSYASQMMLDINMHGLQMAEKILQDLRQWMQEPIRIEYLRSDLSLDLWNKAYNAIKAPDWPLCACPEDFANLPAHIQNECEQDHHVSLKVWQHEVYSQIWTDANGVRAQVTMANYFNPSSLRVINQQLLLQNSDPEKAIQVCYSKKCHHFFNGHLYKCGPVALFPEILQQFPVSVSEHDRRLIQSYAPAKSFWDVSQIADFVAELKQQKSIPQCKFCPEQMTAKKFEAGTKKIKWSKKAVL